MYTVEKYLKLPEVRMPWKSDRSDLSLDGVQGNCCRCHKMLQDLRGHINEWGHGDVVVFDLAGHCPKCNMITTVRNRWYPKDGRVTRLDEGGNWVERPQPKRLYCTSPWLVRVLFRVGIHTAGMGVGILVTLAVAEPSALSWFLWGVVWLVLTGMVFLTERK